MVLFVSAIVCSACATRPTGDHPEQYVTTYYDRNGDGRVDYEFHDIPGWADDEWALRDTDFNGRYDIRYDMGYPGGRSRVDLPVPTSVRISHGKPEGGFDW
jgi:hypothetical protein